MNNAIDVALAIVLRGSKVLICQRLADAHLGGLWEFPGGKILANERREAAALRELREETGIEARIVENWPTIAFNYPERRVCLHPFLCRHVAGEAKTLGCQRAVWIELERLKAYSFPPANEPLLRRLEALSPPV